MSDQQSEEFQTWADQNGAGGDDSEVVRGRIILIFQTGFSKVTKQKMVAEAVVEELQKRGRFYFHAQLRDFSSALFFDAKRKILDRIKSGTFEAWLSLWISINRADPTFSYVMRETESEALNGKSTTGIIPEHYWATREGAIYLSNGDGNAVKITAVSVESITNGTDGVLFACGHTMREWELCDSNDPFQTCSLFRECTCTANHGPNLLKA